MVCLLNWLIIGLESLNKCNKKHTYDFFLTLSLFRQTYIILSYLYNYIRNIRVYFSKIIENVSFRLLIIIQCFHFCIIKKYNLRFNHLSWINFYYLAPSQLLRNIFDSSLFIIVNPCFIVNKYVHVSKCNWKTSSRKKVLVFEQTKRARRLNMRGLTAYVL